MHGLMNTVLVPFASEDEDDPIMNSDGDAPLPDFDAIIQANIEKFLARQLTGTFWAIDEHRNIMMHVLGNEVDVVVLQPQSGSRSS